jgi:hypothetical protein
MTCHAELNSAPNNYSYFETLKSETMNLFQGKLRVTADYRTTLNIVGLKNKYSSGMLVIQMIIKPKLRKDVAATLRA